MSAVASDLQVGLNFVLLATHFILLYWAAVAAKYRVILYCGHCIVVAFASFIYHLCRGYGTCALNATYIDTVKFDYAGALSFIPTHALLGTMDMPALGPRFFTEFVRSHPGYTTTQSKRDLFATVTLYQLLQFFTVYVVYTQDVTTSYTPLCWVLGASGIAVAVKTAFVNSLQGVLLSKYRISILLVGTLLIVVSLVFFPFDGSAYIGIHTLWHIFSFNGSPLVIFAGIILPERLQLEITKESKRDPQESTWPRNTATTTPVATKAVQPISTLDQPARRFVDIGTPHTPAAMELILRWTKAPEKSNSVIMQ